MEDQFDNDTASEVESHRFTPSDMTGSLLQSGFTATEIEDRVAAQPGTVQDWLGDMTSISENSTAELLRLKHFYLREQVKSVFRNSPFLGTKKGAERIGIGPEDFAFIYKALMSSGEITFSMEIPTWFDGDKRVHLRKHYVK
ncbi:MAG: hypothetical protein COT73_05525 [Bdellovibrio sp. CG10_big_fil_rev_8_21_14_0_10_47_8]|nr:MAG: hypothetical protein COT73_05525 [Bdellovibrio sp. CG10_big_fil_rev_8_21_14_0_10_47_8]